jgi:hypothetical protein
MIHITTPGATGQYGTRQYDILLIYQWFVTFSESRACRTAASFRELVPYIHRSIEITISFKHYAFHTLQP